MLALSGGCIKVGYALHSNTYNNCHKYWSFLRTEGRFAPRTMMYHKTTVVEEKMAFFFFQGPTSMARFLFLNHFTKVLGLSLNVDQEEYDHVRGTTSKLSWVDFRLVMTRYKVQHFVASCCFFDGSTFPMVMNVGQSLLACPHVILILS